MDGAAQTRDGLIPKGQRSPPALRVMVMKGLVGYLAGFLVGLPTPLWGQVVLSEVMFDPAGSEFYDEFVEVQNVGDQAVDLTGWRVGDGEETHRIVPVRGSSLVSPGAFGLILDSGYFDHSSLYHPLPDGVLILTVDSPTLGRAGLDNLHSERVVLIAASGDTVATMGYRPGNLPGISKEKINPEAGDGADNWADSRWIGGTPGRINSVSPKVDDLVLEQISNTPLMLPSGQDQAFVAGPNYTWGQTPP